MKQKNQSKKTIKETYKQLRVEKIMLKTFICQLTFFSTTPRTTKIAYNVSFFSL